MSRREAQPKPLREYLEGTAFVGGAIQLLIAIFVGALATSRADGNVISPWTLAAIVTVASVSGVLIGWPIGLYGGASDMLEGLVVLERDARAAGDTPPDAFRARQLWSTTIGWSLAAGAWSLAAAVLVVAVLDGRHAGALLVIVAVAALGGVSGRAVDLAARRRGIDLVRSRVAPATVVPERRRAWLHIALPIAASQAVVNAGLAWLLFRDYVQGDAFAERALTEQAVVAEVATVVLTLVGVFAPIVRSWGAVDLRLGRVRLEEAPSASIGPQSFVYLVVAAFVLGPLAGLLLPTAPTLLRVVVVRGALAGAVVFLIAGLAHVRGAMNAAVETREGLEAETETETKRETEVAVA